MVSYKEKKLKCNMEEYVNSCSRKETAGIAWWRVGIWNLRRIRRGFGKGKCPLCYELEDAKLILLICAGTKRTEEFLCRKWTGLNQDLAFRGKIGCRNAVELKNMRKYLFRIKRNWEKKIQREVGELMSIELRNVLT
jgi:hypothetical protein